MKVRKVLVAVVAGVIFLGGSQSPALAGKKKKVRVVRDVKIKNNDIASGNCISVFAPPCQ